MGLFRKKVGLALGCGGAKGMALVGVLKELEENNIQIDYISGCSAGALVGGIYAATKNINLLEELLFSTKAKELAKYFSDPSLGNGIFKGEKILDILDGYIDKDFKIENTLIPFTAIASDLQSGKKYVFKEGKLRDAIRASISIPVVFEPIMYEDTILVDGGITEAVPVRSVKEMGAEKTIGVNIYTGMFPREIRKDNIGLLKMAMLSSDLSIYRLAQEDMSFADIKLEIPVKDIPLQAFADDPTEYIELGRKITKEQILGIKRLG